jgi:hypothetical protein
MQALLLRLLQRLRFTHLHRCVAPHINHLLLHRRLPRQHTALRHLNLLVATVAAAATALSNLPAVTAVAMVPQQQHQHLHLMAELCHHLRMAPRQLLQVAMDKLAGMVELARVVHRQRVVAHLVKKAIGTALRTS